MAPPPPPLPPYPQQSQPDYDNLPGSDSDSEDGEIHYKDDYEESRSTPLPLESHVLPGFSPLHYYIIVIIQQSCFAFQCPDFVHCGPLTVWEGGVLDSVIVTRCASGFKIVGSGILTVNLVIVSWSSDS